MKGWKTVAFNAGLALVGVVTAAVQTAPIDPQLAGIILAVVAGIGTVLRALTTTPIGKPTA